METLVGKQAPDFKLEGVSHEEWETHALADYRGKWLVLFFYPLDFTFVCPTEITGFSKADGEFEKLNAKVLGVSTDSKHSHKAWLKELGALRYPLLADKTMKVSRDYGVLIEEEGIALRGTFIIDPEGKVRYALVHDNGVGRSVKETLRALQALQSGELCPVEWMPGEKTLGKA
jgi:peroxiredoxin (alkyl hydroperoxide reductase subunit C)